METESNTEELVLHVIRMNAAEKRREIRKALKIGHIICEYSWRSKHNNWASYSGHFDRANAWKLRQRFLARFPWIEQVCVPSHFSYRLEGRTINVEVNPWN